MHRHQLPFHKDQLNVIFDVIGTPTKQDLECVHGDKARAYLSGLTKKPPIDFQARFKGADPQALDLLKRLLQFDPTRRLTARQAMNHPYLQSLRNEQLIQNYHANITKLDLPVENIRNLTPQRIRMLIIEEIIGDHPHLQSKVE